MNVYEKLQKIQHELKAPKNQKNSFGGYNYRSAEDILEALKPLLDKYKCVLTLCDEVLQQEDRFYIKVTAKLVDCDEPSQFVVANALAREPEQLKGQTPAQITGGTSSYARKYALNGLFCIDDTKDPDATNDGKQQEEQPKRVRRSRVNDCPF